MRTLRHIFLAALAAIAMLAQAAEPAEALATRLLDHMDAGDYQAAESLFDARMAAAVPAAKLQEVWQSLPAQLGAAEGREAAQLSPYQDMQVVTIPLRYARGQLVARVTVDAAGKVAGFFIQPAAQSPSSR